MARKPSRPKQSKAKQGAKRNYEVAIVSWIDLLGYGAMLREAAFNPSDPRSVAAVERLRKFHETLAAHADRVFPIFPINDGGVAFRDLSTRGPSVSADFLQRSTTLFATVNQRDQSDGYPGARMTIAIGARIRGQPNLGLDLAKRRNILLRFRNGSIDAEEAIFEAFKSRPIYGFVAELQANFAFTRAYLADNDGSAAGLGGSRCYIDTQPFDDPPPEWISFQRLIPWSTPGMSTVFGELDALNRPLAGAQKHSGIRDGMKIAEALGLKSVRITANVIDRKDP
jgi:hypothetical protein